MLTRWQVARALVGAGLALLAGAAFAPAFGPGPAAALTDPRYSLVLATVVTAVTGTCLLLAAGTRLAPVHRVAVATGVLLGLVLLVVAPGLAALDGPRRLLTSALPLEPAGPELSIVAIVVGIAALGAVEPALRRRAALLPLAAPLAATVLGLSVAAPGGAPPGWLGPAIALGAAGLLVLARRGSAGVSQQPPAQPLRRLVGGLAAAGLVAAAVAAGSVGAGLLAGAGRQAPAQARQLVAPPVQPRSTTSPLVLFPALRSGRRPFSLTITADQPVPLARYVSLESFDGTYWTTQASYRRAGRQLPPGPTAAPVRSFVEQVQIDQPGELGWLVSSGRPTQVSVPELGVNEDSGDVVVPADRPVPAGYTIHSTVPVLDGDALARAAPAPATGAGLPAGQDDLVQWARQATGGERGYPALRRLAGQFADYRLDTGDPPGGHGLFQVRKLRQTRSGTAEQYASAFAVLARALGYDVRVVVGFKPRPDGAGRYQVTGRDVHAWAEVRFTTAGWVPFDPTPSRVASGEDDQEAAGQSPPDASTPPRGTAGPGPSASATPAPATGAPRGRTTRWLALTAAIVLCVLALGGLAVPAVKGVRRRWRRGVRDPGRRTLGAWRETVDRLTDAGVAVPPAYTVGEVVGAVRLRFGDAVAVPVRQLAALHDGAAFAPTPLPAAAADLAWQQADRARRSMSALLPPAARLRAALNPRTLNPRSLNPRSLNPRTPVTSA